MDIVVNVYMFVTKLDSDFWTTVLLFLWLIFELVNNL